jgi:hypothetical protein
MPGRVCGKKKPWPNGTRARLACSEEQRLTSERMLERWPAIDLTPE